MAAGPSRIEINELSEHQNYSQFQNKVKSKQSKCPSTDTHLINRLWHIHTIEYHPAFKKDEILKHETKWINMENIMPSKLGQMQGDKQHLTPLIWSTECCLNRDSMEVGVCQKWGQRLLLSGHTISTWENENVLEVDIAGYCTTLWLYLICKTWSLKNV